MYINIPDLTREITIKTDTDTLVYKVEDGQLVLVTEHIPITALSLSAQGKNALQNAGINTIPELLSYSRKDLLKRARNLGVRTLDEIAVELEKAGYKEAFLRFALPECTMDELEEARQDPESTLTLDPSYCYRLYRAGIKTLDQIGEYDEHALLNKGLCKADLEKIQLLFSD